MRHGLRGYHRLPFLKGQLFKKKKETHRNTETLMVLRWSGSLFDPEVAILWATMNPLNAKKTRGSQALKQGFLRKHDVQS